MTRTRLLHLEGESSDHGQAHLEHVVGLVLEAARAGLMRPVQDGTGRLFMDGGMETLVVVEGDGDRPAPDRAHVNRFLVDALDRPHADRATIEAARSTMACVAAFVDTDQEHMIMRAATPWQDPYVAGCPCPFLRPDPQGMPRTEIPFDDDLASLLPDAVCAVVDGGRLSLRPLGWGASLDPDRIQWKGSRPLPDIPDAMTALRTVHGIRSIRDRTRAAHPIGPDATDAQEADATRAPVDPRDAGDAVRSVAGTMG
jgi:hypothetical protein